MNGVYSATTHINDEFQRDHPQHTAQQIFDAGIRRLFAGTHFIIYFFISFIFHAHEISAKSITQMREIKSQINRKGVTKSSTNGEKKNVKHTKNYGSHT